MKQSRRTKRMQKHHERRADRNASLNMVSLMDIFTILVFFLLVSAANTEVLPTPKNIKLPESSAQKPPKENIIIMVNSTDVLVQGRKVGDVQAILRSKDPVIKPLGNELKQIAITSAGNDPVESVTKRGVTIMGDKEIPYGLLKKIMMTCSLADYSNISLAVAMRADPEAEAP